MSYSLRVNIHQLVRSEKKSCKTCKNTFYLKQQQAYNSVHVTVEMLLLYKTALKVSSSYYIVGNSLYAYMGDFNRGGEWLLKLGLFFYGKIYNLLNISIDGLQATCRYQLKVSRGPQNFSLELAFVELD